MAGCLTLLAFVGTTRFPVALIAIDAPLSSSRLPEVSAPSTSSPDAPPFAPVPLPAIPLFTPPPPVLPTETLAMQAPRVTPPKFNKRLDDLPSVRELRGFRAIDRPLLAKAGRELTEGERTRAARVLEEYVDKAYDRASSRLGVLLKHLRGEPDSPFAISLWLEVSSVAQNSGDFALAIESAREAWIRARRVSEGGGVAGGGGASAGQYCHALCEVGPASEA